MSFTVATVLTFNGERGIALTGLGEKIYFDKTSVPLDDRHGMHEGSVVIYTDGTVELATSSFVSYQELTREMYTSETTITEA